MYVYDPVGDRFIKLSDTTTDTPELLELEPRCGFCGGKLSEVRVTKDGKKYRHCYGCHFDRGVNG